MGMMGDEYVVRVHVTCMQQSVHIHAWGWVTVGMGL